MASPMKGGWNERGGGMDGEGGNRKPIRPTKLLQYTIQTEQNKFNARKTFINRYWHQVVIWRCG